MNWNKSGRVFVANKHSNWMVSHAMIPTPILLNEAVLRIYTTFCDENKVGRVGYVDVSADNPSYILGWSKEPCLDIGKPGQFDDNGVVGCSVILLPNGRIRMYYAGFELCHRVRHRILTGIAESDDGGHFVRLQNMPFLERSEDESFCRGAPFCYSSGNQHKLWYAASNDWIKVNGVEKLVSVIKMTESLDGLDWSGASKLCFDIDFDHEFGFSRPYVRKNGVNYEMYYTIRDYKIGYRLGYAVSSDGLKWQRQDEFVNFPPGVDGEWDSEMLCYPAVITIKNQTYLFYSGNNFGETGFGYAQLIKNE